MTTTQCSHIRFKSNGTLPREPSSISDTQIDCDVEPKSFLNVTPADALHTRPNTEESIPVYDEGPSNLSPNRSLSYDRISDVMGVVSGAGIIQHSDTSDNPRTMHSRPIDHSWDSESGGGREEHHTISPNHSIRTPLSDSDGIHQDRSSTSVESWRAWTPIFLQAASILFFVVAYAFLLVALIILGILDNRNQGLATVGSRIRYVCKYGPTAVLATLAGLWGQVEHRTKQMMPWAILRQGPTCAADALLLNYIELPQLVSLYTSIKKRHHPITLAIVGSLLIQLLTVISTGLLMLQVERIHHHGVSIRTTEVFNKNLRLNLNPYDQAIGSLPVLSTIALNGGNLSYPPGTSDRLAFSTINIQDTIKGGKNMSIETTTDVFHAELGCELVTDSRWDDTCELLDGHCLYANAVVRFSTPSCHVENLTMGSIQGFESKGIFGGSSSMRCDNSSASKRFVIVLAEYMIGLEYDESGGLQANQKLTIDNTSLLLCQPSYSIEPWSLTVNDTGTLVNESNRTLLEPTNSSSLPLTQWDFMEAFLQSIANADKAALGPAFSTSFGPASSDRDSGITDAQLNDFFYALVAFSKLPNIADLLDAKVLLNETTRFFSMASAQLARSYLMTPSSKVVTGTVSTDEQRLRIRGLSYYLMMATLGFLIVDAALLCFMCPRNTVSRDPGSVGGLAVIMTESPSFCGVLSGKSLWSKSRLHSSLSSYQALSVLEESNNRSEFRVVLVRHSSMTNNSERKDDQHGVRWWQPISTRLWAKSAVTAFLLLLIAALESTYQASKQHDGLGDVDSKSYIRYIWAYVPATAMFTVQLLVGMIGDSSKMIFTYHELRQKLNCKTRNLFSDPLSKVTVHAVYSATRIGQYALLATGFSMLLTPFLTIVSSGLFSPESTTHTYDSTFRIRDVLKTSIDLGSAALHKRALGSQSAFNLGLILTNNLSYPEWTYRELAFHRMTINEIKNAHKDLDAMYPSPTGLTIRATVPAIRPDLSCTYFAPEHVHIFYTKFSSYNSMTNESNPYIDINIHTNEAVQMSLPEECRNHMVNWTLPGNLTDHQSQPFAWFGTITVMGAFRGSHCSNIIAAFGSSLKNGSAQTMVCVPVVKQVQTDTTFSLPSYQIISATPNDMTARPIANFTAAAINLNDFMPVGALSSDTSATDNGNYDPTFTALLAAPGAAMLVSDDFDATNAAHPRIANALQHLFRLTYAQVLSGSARSDVPANAGNSIASGNSSVPRLLDGQIIDSQSRMRLKQSAVPTRILEGLLGAIVVCLLVSFWLLDTRKVMPENACSIAGAASLFVGADMLRGVPRGAEWWNDDEAVKKEVFGKDAVFSLGWWGAEERETETGDRERNMGAVIERDGSEEVQGLRRRRFGIDRGRASWY